MFFLLFSCMYLFWWIHWRWLLTQCSFTPEKYQSAILWIMFNCYTFLSKDKCLRWHAIRNSLVQNQTFSGICSNLNSNFFNNKTFRYSKQQIIITNIRMLNEYMYCTCVFKKCLIMWKTLSHHFIIIYVYGYSDCGTNTVTLLWTLSSGKKIIFKKAHFNLYILTEFDIHIL